MKYESDTSKLFTKLNPTTEFVILEYTNQRKKEKKKKKKTVKFEAIREREIKLPVFPRNSENTLQMKKK